MEWQPRLVAATERIAINASGHLRFYFSAHDLQHKIPVTLRHFVPAASGHLNLTRVVLHASQQRQGY